MKHGVGRALRNSQWHADQLLAPFDSVPGSAAMMWRSMMVTHQIGAIWCTSVIVYTYTATGFLERGLFHGLCAVGVNMATNRWITRRRRLPTALPFLDLAGILIVCLDVPTLQPRIGPFTLVIVALAAISLSARALVGLLSFHLLTTAVAIMVSIVPEPRQAFASYVVLSVLTVVPVRLTIRALKALSDRHTEIFASIDAILWEETEERGVLAVSAGAATTLGQSSAQWSEPWFWLTLVHPDDVGSFVEQIEELRASNDRLTTTVRMRRADGSYAWVEHRIDVIADVRRSHQFLRGVSIDRTAEVLSAQNEQRFAEVVEDSVLGHCVLAFDDIADLASLRVLLSNPALDAMFPDTVFGRPGALMSELGFAADQLRPLEMIAAQVASTGEPVTFDRWQLADQFFDVRFRSLSGASISLSFENVTERVAALDELEAIANTDALTGLPNRLAYRVQLARALPDRCIDRPIAVVVLDLNQFKEVNDTLGHEVGDHLLVEVADRMRATWPDFTLARLGGDEFAAFGEVGERDDGRRLATALLDALAVDVHIDDITVQTSASIGLSFWPDHGDSVDELVRRADAAMYVAKRQGGGWIEHDDRSDSSTVRRLRLTSEMREAFTKEQFELWYQPRVSVASSEVVGVEALVRWRHPDFGVVGPDEFVPLAEVSGVIRDLTRWVIASAFDQAHALATAGHRLSVSLNVSARSLYDPELVAWTGRLIAERGLPLGGVTFELTETAIMDDVGAARRLLEGLVDLGIATSIDDFGTGYTSLAQLRTLPLHEIKIDGSLVSGIASRCEDAALVEAVVVLGHHLGMRTVAEGVQDRETLEILGSFDCELAEGFLFGHPLPFSYLVDLLGAPHHVLSHEVDLA